MIADPLDPADRAEVDVIAGAPTRRSTLPSLAFDLGVATVLFVTVTIGLRPWYSARLFDRDAFTSYYGQGIYQSRLLGRELVLWVDRSVVPGDPLGSHLVVNGIHPHRADLFTAMFVVNALALVALVLLARSVVARAGIVEPARSLLVLVVVLVTTISLSTVTPYDLPSVALILAVLVAASSRPPWDLLAVPLVVVGTLTRESALLAVAALIAQASVVPPSRRRVALIAVAGVAGAATFLGVRIGAASVVFWDTLTIEGNLARLAQWIGLATMVIVYLIWRRTCGLAGLGGPPQRRPVGAFWVLASPYVITALLTGYWFEFRLLVPLVVCELWLRSEVAGHGQLTESRQSASPLAGSSRSRSRSSTVTKPADSS